MTGGGAAGNWDFDPDGVGEQGRSRRTNGTVLLLLQLMVKAIPLVPLD